MCNCTSGESSNSGFDASHRPGMTRKAENVMTLTATTISGPRARIDLTKPVLWLFAGA